MQVVLEPALYIISSYAGGGGLFGPYRKPTSTVNFLTKFGMCIELCMTLKFQF